MHRALLFATSLVVFSACDETKAPAPATSAAPAAAAAESPATVASASAVATAQAADAAPAAPADAIVAQHVLVAYKGAKGAPKDVTRSKAEAKARAEKVRADAAAGTPFEELVASSSDDASSKGRLGSLGKFKRDAMVKPFSDAAFALRPGEVSAVVETPFGFHVIKRTQ